MFEKLFGKKTDTEILNRDNAAALLHISKDELSLMEKQYGSLLDKLDSENIQNKPLFDINAKQMADHKTGVMNDNKELDDIIHRIVSELVSNTPVWHYDSSYDGTQAVKSLVEKEEVMPVTKEEILKLPEHIRPQLTGSLMMKDIKEPAYLVVLGYYRQYLKETNPKKKQMMYHHFRQGLDILDIDEILYQIIGTNPNSMGHWLPNIAAGANLSGFFQIPKTTVIKVPVTMLQLTRLSYENMTRTTLDIVDEFCQKVFSLDETKEYFIKTGTYSSKFDFRNACVRGAKEVRELGEYLLFIHSQANQMASPLSQPSIYGMSTTNEWVVREFIPDKEDNLCIYKGLPMHTEYRVFADFDTKEVIGMAPYWDKKLMMNRFMGGFGHDPHDRHDLITYTNHEPVLNERYQENENIVRRQAELLVQNTEGLTGQWSIDIMQNGDDFWLIDMALAQNSALKECIPKELRKTWEKDWIPKLG